MLQKVNCRYGVKGPDHGVLPMITADNSPSTVRRAHAALHRALEQAVRWRLVPVNVAGLVDPPRPVRRDMTAFAPDQVRQLLAAAEGDRLEALYVLAVTAGFRQGQLLALRWADVDVYHGWLKVVGSLARARGWGWSVTGPNTARSRRRLR